MQVFEHPNMIKFMCPICRTADNKPVALVPVPGTEEGNKCRAVQIHVACLQDAANFKLQEVQNHAKA